MEIDVKIDVEFDSRLYHQCTWIPRFFVDLAQVKPLQADDQAFD